MKKTKTLNNELKEYCLKNNIPIIHEDSIDFINELIKAEKIISILEIGTGYGYSAIRFSNEETLIDTIEKDINHYNEAIYWTKESGYHINVINHDATLYNDINKQYDLIFIDGPKGQYEKLFNKYAIYLNDNGIIICDNINFHNLKIDEVKNKGTKNLLKKLDMFKSFLNNNQSFETTILNIGDGLSISRKRK